VSTYTDALFLLNKAHHDFLKTCYALSSVPSTLDTLDFLVELESRMTYLMLQAQDGIPLLSTDCEIIPFLTKRSSRDDSDRKETSGSSG